MGLNIYRNPNLLLVCWVMGHRLMVERVLLLASTLVALGPYLEEKSLFCPIWMFPSLPGTSLPLLSFASLLLPTSSLFLFFYFPIPLLNSPPSLPNYVQSISNSFEVSFYFLLKFTFNGIVILLKTYLQWNLNFVCIFFWKKYIWNHDFITFFWLRKSQHNHDFIVILKKQHNKIKIIISLC